jgi:hypothetical protein
MESIADMPASLKQAETSPEAKERNARSSGTQATGWLFAFTIFLSAFLLFQVQLLLGKQILPQFGGAPAVWTACLLTFQLLLLVGYAYSHGVVLKLTSRGQVVAQVALLGVSVGVLAWHLSGWKTPITLGDAWQASSALDPTWSIIGFLLVAIGLPFFALSTTGPLIQHWFSRVAPGASPYRLYALSNAGSLLGLLSYPFFVEPHLHLKAQAWIWVGSYLLFALGYVGCASLANRAVNDFGKEGGKPAHEGSLRVGQGAKIAALQIALAACASVMLLASTNLICQELTVIPFLWVLPLSLYLLSFIFCFESDRWYRRAVFHPLLAVCLGWVLWLSIPNTTHSVVAQVAGYSALLFAICMVCHGEAALTRPPAEGLTGFYLRIALGGALGGIFVSLIAPQIFPNYWEYPLGVLACVALLLVLVQRDASSWWYTSGGPAALLLLSEVAFLAPLVAKPVWEGVERIPEQASQAVAAALALAAVIWYLVQRSTGRARAAPTAVRTAFRVGLALVTAGLVIPQKAEFYHVIARSRNFYGVLSVVEEEKDNYLVLRHGKTLHGFQYQDAARSREATGYYGPNSGANIVIRDWPSHPMRVGLVGMGIGTLAALGKPGDTFRFYEINPDVYRWSSGGHPYFTYLRDSPAKIEVVLGDARVSLQREATRGEFQKFDVLVLDAFSSDAIPMHLLTREAFSLYEKHLRDPQSVIAVHISNQTLNLRPVLAGIAQEFGFHALRVYPLLPAGPFSQSDWILLSRDASFLSGAELMQKGLPFPDKMKPILWTDDNSDLFHILRWRD